MKKNSGQTLILLIFFVMTALAITVASIFLLVINNSSTSDLQQGVEAKELADSGAENAILRLERDQSYSGETYTINGSQVVITISNDKKAATSTATVNNFTKKVEVIVNYNNNILSVDSWKEIF